MVLLVLLLCSLRIDETPAPTHPALKHELAAMVKADQAARFKLIESMKNKRVDSLAGVLTAEFSAVNEVDKKNLARLKEIIAQHGWPTITMVGPDGAHDVWLLVQHCDADRPFQKECLRLMERAAAVGQASKKDLAYLTDRVLVGEGKPQRYGTQADFRNGKAILKDVEDPERLDERRANVGLGPVADYLKQIEALYGDGK